MSIATELRHLISSGVQRIGEIEILTNLHGHAYVLCHHLDTDACQETGFGGLTVHHQPDDARAISIYAEDGSYRFAKGQTNLKRGWALALADDQQLRQALDLFYPAAVALHLAQRNGTLEVQHLRDKLERQTGMYRYARNISNAGAQQLVREVCGPAHQCAKRILWQIDPKTALEESEASTYDGIPGDLPAHQAIPLLCREACNHFVAECRRVAKAEHEAKGA